MGIGVPTEKYFAKNLKKVLIFTNSCDKIGPVLKDCEYRH